MVSNSLDVAAAQQAQNEALTRQLGLTDATADLFCVPGLTNSWALCGGGLFQQQQPVSSSVLAPIDNHAVGSKRSAADTGAAASGALAPAAKRPCLEAASAVVPEQVSLMARVSGLVHADGILTLGVPCTWSTSYLLAFVGSV